MIKVVFDTNVYISSVLWEGFPGRVVDLAVAGEIKSFTSIEILKEVKSVLIEKFPKIPYERVKGIVRDILSYSSIVVFKELNIDKLRDLKDIPILACAVSAKANYIVTGDKDLLILKEFKEIKIVNAKSFWEEVSKKGF